MSRSIYGWTMLILSGLAMSLIGQACGITNTGGNQNGSPDPLAPLVPGEDPLAPLVPDPDPLAPLVPTRGQCGYWTGSLSGTTTENETRHIECPWSDGTMDVDDYTIDTEHKVNCSLTFPDVWGANPWGTSCAPSGTTQKAVRSEGSVEYTYSFTYDHDWGDNCRYHHSTTDDTFVLNVQADNVSATVEVYPRPYTYTEQQAILAERPCRTEYPIRVEIRISSTGATGAGTHSWTDRSEDKCPACDSCPVPGALESDGSEDVDSNTAASVTVILYGTYKLDANGRDTIEASYKGSALVDPQPDGKCSSVNASCNSQCQDLLSQDYTLTLTRTPDGDRDMDMECDSLDPCPDDAFENECDGAP